MGTNLFVGSITGRDAGGATRLRTSEGMIAVATDQEDGEVFATVSPKAITLYRERPEASAQNVFAGPILELIPEPPGGERVRVVLGTHPVLVAEVTREAVAALALKEGLTVYAGFKATGVTIYS